MLDDLLPGYIFICLRGSVPHKVLKCVKTMERVKDEFTKSWIIENLVRICAQYEPGELTLRGLHYQLVGLGMTNSLQHYKRVVSAMGDARWDGTISFEQFSDLDRGMSAKTEAEDMTLEEAIDEAQRAIENWMQYYTIDRWANQPIFPEVWIEKKALLGVFGNPCYNHRVGLGACKGYPSLTFLNEAAHRFLEYIDMGKEVVIIYFGDYDPSGEDIPRSIGEKLGMLGVDVRVKRVALMEEQVRQLRLPPAPVKLTDSRTANWDGIGQVELDAVRPEILREWLSKAVEEEFDRTLYQETQERKQLEGEKYRVALKDFVKSL